MVMDALVIPKTAYNVLRQLTGETRPDIAFSLALKDLVRLRLEETRTRITTFEQKYGTAFDEFAKKWEAGQIPDAYSYSVERDYWEWEAAVTDLAIIEVL